MLAGPRKSKQQPRDGLEPRGMDLLEAVAMDPDTEHMYRAGRLQQQRHRAAHHANPQLSSTDLASSLENEDLNSSMHASSEIVTQSIQSAALHPHDRPHRTDITHTRPSPYSLQRQLVRQKQLAAVPGCGPQAVLSSAPDGRDIGDDELYLRRVSVLYHEMWSSDWVDINTAKDSISTTRVNSKNTPQTETPPPTPAQSKAASHAPTEKSETVLSSAAIAAANRYSTWTLLDVCADENIDIQHSSHKFDPKLFNKELPPLPPLPPAAISIPPKADNLTQDKHNSDPIQATPRQPHQQQQQQQQDSRSSWGSLIESYMERSGTSSQTLAVDQQPAISRFSPSELADALIGTVHRLEDDSTLAQLKRWSVVKELAITEAQYLRDLLLLRTVFYEPMVCGSDNSMLRAEDIHTIFGNLDQVIDCARSLVEYLTVAVVYESNRCFMARDGSIRSAAEQGSGRCEGHFPSAGTANDRPGSEKAALASGFTTSAASSFTRRECTSRPASQPEANFAHGDASNSDAGLRNSAWADISIAQAFLLTSQRMERVYGQYCRNFEAATQRLVEIKRSAAAIGTDATTPLTMPPTPITAYRAPLATSPFAEHQRGSRNAGVFVGGGNSFGVGNGNGNRGSKNSSVFPGSAGLDYYESADMHSDLGDPDAMYCAFIYQFMSDQNQSLEGKTTSWDLPSLLIKPVQRILKYPLLIRSLLGLTPPHTSDHGRLEKAAFIVENIAETINAFNGCNGLRISTATTASQGFAGGDDGQSRITREIRRVLRRKGGGNVTLAWSKPSVESTAKDKSRAPGGPKSRVKEATERPSSSSVHGGSSQSSGAEALIEQHEMRLSELIRSLRRWENDLGTMLCQQAALAGRWKDLYALSEHENGGGSSTATPVDGNIHIPCPTSSYSDVPFKVSSDTRSHNAHAGWQRQPNPEPQRMDAQPDVRTSKSHNVLRNQIQHGVPDRSKHGLPTVVVNSSGQTDFITAPNSPKGDESTWWTFKGASVAKYHTALDTIFKTLYPKAICNPLHSRIYPVLTSLLQVYSDGPRYILSEISRATNPSNSSIFSNPDHGDERASKLRGILATDLPKLFEHEKTIVRLILEQIIVIERDFYNQVAKHLSSLEFGTGLTWPLHRPGQARERTVDESSEGASRADNTPGSRLHSSRSKKLPPLQPESGASGWSTQIISSYTQRFAERYQISPDVVFPAGTECISKIQAGLWLLAQETEKNGPSQCVVKSRRRQSFAAPSDTTDSRSEFSITFDEYSETSVFTQPEAAHPAATMSTPTSGTSAFGIPSVFDGPNVGISSDMLNWQHRDTRSVSSKHVRKKSSGFIDRFVHLRPGRSARGQAALFGGGGNSSSSTLPLDFGAEQVKPRAQLGLAINVNKNNQTGITGSRVRSRSTNCVNPTNPLQDKNGNWSTKPERYEPLPLVDSIRFSKGFIDTAFRTLGSEGLPPRAAKAADALRAKVNEQ
ncbi:hypothetical protein IW138_000870 [Coemansia sp. RSA 986]|nr:hypothetical protein IW138_000870 [Coemansia sp. RSA 986]